MRFRKLAHFASFALVTALIGSQAEASFIVNIVQSGSNVVATGSGSINTTALSDQGPDGSVAGVEGDVGFLGLGPTVNTGVTDFTGFSGPSSFGSGSAQNAASGTGDAVFIVAGLGDLLAVPGDYTPGSALSDTAGWSSTTIAALGLTPGSYVWTWGSGETADSFTVNIGPQSAPAPEPGTICLLGLGCIGLGLARRRSRKHAVRP